MISAQEFAAASRILPEALASHPGSILPPVGQDQAHEAWVTKWSGDAVRGVGLSSSSFSDFCLL